MGIENDGFEFNAFEGTSMETSGLDNFECKGTIIILKCFKWKIWNAETFILLINYG